MGILMLRSLESRSQAARFVANPGSRISITVYVVSATTLPAETTTRDTERNSEQLTEHGTRDVPHRTRSREK